VLRELRRDRLARLGILRPRPILKLTPVQTILNWLILVLVALAAVFKIGVALQPSIVAQAQAATLPLGAVEYVRAARPAGPMLNSYNWGGYLIWTLYPDYRVFVDGRTDLYDDAFLREYLDVAMARPEWSKVLERYGVNLILVERDGPLAMFLQTAGQGYGWRLAYGDAQAAVFVRQES
jgi:hypothetical protein